MKYDFLIDAYESERVKVLSVWSEFKDEDLPLRPLQGDPRGRSVCEQMVHQCVSEDAWFRSMLDIDVNSAPLPRQETRTEFMKRYAEDSARRLIAIRERSESWWDAILLRRSHKGLGHDATPDSHRPPPRATDGDAAHARPQSA